MPRSLALFSTPLGNTSSGGHTTTDNGHTTIGNAFYRRPRYDDGYDNEDDETYAIVCSRTHERTQAEFNQLYRPVSRHVCLRYAARTPRVVFWALVTTRAPVQTPCGARQNALFYTGSPPPDRPLTRYKTLAFQQNRSNAPNELCR